MKTFPPDVRSLLNEMRAAIQRAAPDATEAISYQMPTFKLEGKNLVHFAGYAHHIGFYPGAAAVVAFAEEIAPFKSAKGSIQFPLDRKLPLGLVGRIVKFRVREHREQRARRTSRA